MGFVSSINKNIAQTSPTYFLDTRFAWHLKSLPLNILGGQQCIPAAQWIRHGPLESLWDAIIYNIQIKCWQSSSVIKSGLRVFWTQVEEPDAWGAPPETGYSFIVPRLVLSDWICSPAHIWKRVPSVIIWCRRAVCHPVTSLPSRLGAVTRCVTVRRYSFMAFGPKNLQRIRLLL